MIRNCARVAKDTLYIITEVHEKTKQKIEREITRLKDYIVRLEIHVTSHNSQILDFGAKSMET